MNKLFVLLLLAANLHAQSATPIEDMFNEYNNKLVQIQSLTIQIKSLNAQLTLIQDKENADQLVITDLNGKLVNVQASLDAANLQIAALQAKIGSMTIVISDIQTTVAKTCGTCGNTGGSTNTADAVYNQTLNMSDAPQPNSGHVGLFDIAGKVPYANAYWYWPHTPPTTDKVAFDYEFDLYFTAADKTASQAIEWEMQLDDAGLVYNYAYQLQFGGNKLRTFDKLTRAWIATQYDLSLFTADKWHHIVMHNLFNASAKTLTIDTISIDGTVLKINITKLAPPSKLTGRHFTNAFQLDSNGKTLPTPYKSYVDNMRVSYYADSIN